MSRGNRKAAIVEDDIDRLLFMNTLSETAMRYGVRVYSACLMDNHYHAILDTPRGNLSDAMRQINGIYSQTSNMRHNRRGHTFEARFHSVVVQGERYLRHATRYVVVNPVDAGLCQDACDWRWSTYRATVGLEEPPPWLYLNWLEWAFNAEARSEAQNRYRCYVEQQSTESNGDRKVTAFDKKPLEALAKQWLRDVEFDRPLPVPDPSTIPAPPLLEAIFATGFATVEERDHLIYVAHAVYGYRLAEIATYLRRDASVVGKAFRRYARKRFTGNLTT